MNNSITLYRVDNPTGDQQLWYNRDGSFNPVVEKLSSGRLVPLPMTYDEKYGKDGFRWISAASTIENLREWICLEDAKDLQASGYHILRLEVTMHDFWDNHAVFTWESVQRKEVLHYGELYEELKIIEQEVTSLI